MDTLPGNIKNKGMRGSHFREMDVSSHCGSLVWLQMYPCPQHPTPHSTEGCGLGGARLIQVCLENVLSGRQQHIKDTIKTERKNQLALTSYIYRVSFSDKSH